MKLRKVSNIEEEMKVVEALEDTMPAKPLPTDEVIEEIRDIKPGTFFNIGRIRKVDVASKFSGGKLNKETGEVYPKVQIFKCTEEQGSTGKAYGNTAKVKAYRQENGIEGGQRSYDFDWIIPEKVSRSVRTGRPCLNFYPNINGRRPQVRYFISIDDGDCTPISKQDMVPYLTPAAARDLMTPYEQRPAMSPSGQEFLTYGLDTVYYIKDLGHSVMNVGEELEEEMVEEGVDKKAFADEVRKNSLFRGLSDATINKLRLVCLLDKEEMGEKVKEVSPQDVIDFVDDIGSFGDIILQYYEKLGQDALRELAVADRTFMKALIKVGQEYTLLDAEGNINPEVYVGYGDTISDNYKITPEHLVVDTVIDLKDKQVIQDTMDDIKKYYFKFEGCKRPSGKPLNERKRSKYGKEIFPAGDPVKNMQAFNHAMGSDVVPEGGVEVGGSEGCCEDLNEAKNNVTVCNILNDNRGEWENAYPWRNMQKAVLDCLENHKDEMDENNYKECARKIGGCKNEGGFYSTIGTYLTCQRVESLKEAKEEFPNKEKHEFIQNIGGVDVYHCKDCNKYVAMINGKKVKKNSVQEIKNCIEGVCNESLNEVNEKDFDLEYFKNKIKEYSKDEVEYTEDLVYEILDNMSSSGNLIIPKDFVAEWVPWQDRYWDDLEDWEQEDAIEQEFENVSDECANAYFEKLINKYNLIKEAEKLLKESLTDGKVDSHELEIIDRLISKFRNEYKLEGKELYDACIKAGMTKEEINAFVISDEELKESLNESNEEEVIPEEPTIELPKEEPSKELINNSFSNMIRDLINQKWSLIDNTKGIISSLDLDGFEGDKESIKSILNQIIDDSTIDVGMLTKALEIVDIHTKNLVDNGVEKAEVIVSEPAGKDLK